MTKRLNILAREIIENNQYLAISTLNKDNNPWTCTLAYTFDQDFNFYFVSLPTSKHSQNFLVNSNISFAIYDSRQGFGTGAGLQIEAIVEKTKLAELPKVIKLYFGRKYPYGNVSNAFSQGLKALLRSKVYEFYKLVPSKIWINDPNANTDVRVEVKL